MTTQQQTTLQKGHYYACTSCGYTTYVGVTPFHAQCGHDDTKQAEITPAEYLERHFGKCYGEGDK